MTYSLVIDDHPFKTEDPILTGRQLLELADRIPIEEHLVMFLGSGRGA